MIIKEYTVYREDEILKLYASVGWTAYTKDPEAYGVKPDFPWGQSPHEHSGVFRHADSGKWFALIMRIRREQLTKDGEKTPVDVMNLKIDPDEPSPLRNGVYPAFHMNHKSWITVTLDDTLSDDEVMEHIETSFRMTGKRGSR